MKMPIRTFLLLLIVAISARTARGELLIRIGDVDGFGYGAAPGFKSAAGGNANVDGQGNLGALDFLPDINKNGRVQHHEGDNFDLRDTSEAGDVKVEHCNCVIPLPGNAGSKFTDISLTTSYNNAQSFDPPRVLIGGNPIDGLQRGLGGDFPTGRPSENLAADPHKGNQPGFSFRFAVGKSALSLGAPIFFNTLLADFDVPTDQANGIAYLRIQPLYGEEQQLALRRQNNSMGQDGLIKGGTLELAFADVFTDEGDVWVGGVDVDFLAPNELYTAFDFAELSTTALIPKRTGDYEDDGDVDLHDYTRWKQLYGSSNPAADGNGNGIVDAADYTIWRDNLSTSVASGNASAAGIPEPSTARLFVLTVASYTFLRQRNGTYSVLGTGYPG